MPGGWGDLAGGAGKGAAIGSFIPGIGTGIGAAIGGGLGWLFGGGDDDDEKKKDAHPEDQYKSILESSAKSNAATGAAYSDMGTATLEPVMKQLRALLSSNPGDVMDATRGDRGRVMDQYDTARRSIANFGSRGGGTTSVLAASQYDQAESLADITSGAKQHALTTGGALGTAAAGLGLQANQLASQDLETVINSVLAREGLDTAKRGQNMSMLGDIGTAVGTIVGIALGKNDA